jgi:general secretion pathway protein N
MTRKAIALLVGTLVIADATALAATPPVVVEPREEGLGLLGHAAPPPAVTAAAASTAPAAASSVERVPSGNPLWAVPLRQLSATRDRPLFAPSRRPPAPVVAYQLASAPPPPPSKPAEPEKPRLSLVGTIARGEERIGMFLDESTRSVLRLKMGEDHEGWVLRGLKRREVTLEKGRQIAVLTLPAPEVSRPGSVPPAPAVAGGTSAQKISAPAAANTPVAPTFVPLTFPHAPAATGTNPFQQPQYGRR